MSGHQIKLSWNEHKLNNEALTLLTCAIPPPPPQLFYQSSLLNRKSS